MRYDCDHKLQTRQRVLRAAARAIRSDGPTRVGVAGVMREAGLTHGGFYAHFQSKDELIAAAITQMFEDSIAHWHRAHDGKGDADGLAAYLRVYLSAAHRDAPGHGCPIAALSGEIPRLDVAARDAFSAGSRRLQDALAASLERLGHDDAPALAASVLAELVGTLAMTRCESDRARSDALLASSRRQLGQRLNLEIDA
ncbi:TetR/AcrR family transcriptional regulator [Lysobacter arenosi]|uniref:TetR/AcrR family transcriptional regulator n=1 Tax=Lysobacter arenosi TaxID=2795387 RepID=A0ABX7RAU6_9GAMM|nr:TetR/AcrR family transcriptional regulator [Lysobacter arenosi]QSX74623.1 TetR/AcrR family transcriptional regulator [Lysobacter arenosi]